MLRSLAFLFSVLMTVQTLAATTLTVPAAAPQPVTSIKGFHEWKSEKIQVASNQVALIRSQILKAQTENNKKNAEALEKQLSQLKWNTEVARDLSVTDYFVLYLSQQTQADRFNQAAAKLTTKEVAELMEAYADTLSSTPTEVVVRPSASPGLLSKIPVQAIQYRDQLK